MKNADFEIRLRGIDKSSIPGSELAKKGPVVQSDVETPHLLDVPTSHLTKAAGVPG